MNSRKDFSSPKLSLESWILHCIRENFSEYLRDVTVEKLRIVSSTALFTVYKLQTELILKLVPGCSFACAKTIRALVGLML